MVREAPTVLCLVTTKKATKGKVQVSVNAYVKTSEPPTKSTLLSPTTLVWVNYERIRPQRRKRRQWLCAANFGQPLRNVLIYQGEEG